MGQFTKANAREMALRSFAPESKRFVRPLNPANEIPEKDLFRLERLARVRAQLNRLDKLLNETTVPAELDKLASATARLAEQERQLAGRPMPGAYRPGLPKRGRESKEPVERRPLSLPESFTVEVLPEETERGNSDAAG